MESKIISSLASVHLIDLDLARSLFQQGYRKNKKSLKEALINNLIQEDSYLTVKRKVKNNVEPYQKFLELKWIGTYAIFDGSVEDLQDCLTISLDDEFHILNINEEFPLLVKIVKRTRGDLFEFIVNDNRTKIIDLCWHRKYTVDLMDERFDLENLQMFKLLLDLYNANKITLVNTEAFIEKIVSINNIHLVRIFCHRVSINYSFLSESFIEFIFRELNLDEGREDIPVEDISEENLSEVYQSASGKNKWNEQPFFVNVVEPISSSDRCIVNTLYSIKNGWSPEHILTSPFAFFTHDTHIEFLPKILESNMMIPSHFTTSKEKLEKQVQTGEGPIRLDQYPGSYLTLRNHRLVTIVKRRDEIFSVFGDFTFIISLALLRKRGWHMNISEDYGAISQLTCDYKSLADYISLNDINPVKWIEFVAHYPIPLDYVEAIVCHDPEYKEEIEEIVNGRFDVYTVEEFWEIPTYKRVKLLYDEGPYSNEPPNFCYLNTTVGAGADCIVPKHNLYCTLRNSGFNKEQAKSIIKEKSYLEIWKLLDSMWKDNLLTGKTYYPVIHPPY